MEKETDSDNSYVAVRIMDDILEEERIRQCFEGVSLRQGREGCSKWDQHGQSVEDREGM